CVYSDAMSESNFAARREAFRKLHKSGCFVIPNPWDPGSARYLKHLGFKALATTSAGFAFSRGLPDDGGVVSRDAVLGNIAEITAAVDLPVNADFQSGYADEPETVAEMSGCASVRVWPVFRLRTIPDIARSRCMNYGSLSSALKPPDRPSTALSPQCY